MATTVAPLITTAIAATAASGPLVDYLWMLILGFIIAFVLAFSVGCLKIFILYHSLKQLQNGERPRVAPQRSQEGRQEERGGQAQRAATTTPLLNSDSSHQSGGRAIRKEPGMEDES